MRRRSVYCGTVLLAGVFLASPSGMAQGRFGFSRSRFTSRSGGGGKWELYREIVERNIFSRSRRRRGELGGPPPAREERPAAAPPADSQGGIVLVGVSRVGERLFAFFEDRRTSELHALTVRGVIAGRTVEEITLDGVKLRRGDTTRVISVGMNLEGELAARRVVQEKPSGGGQSGSAEGSSGAAAPRAPSPEIQSILQKLMQRRLQQLRQ